MAPAKALQKVKRFLRRGMTKPDGMSIRTFMHHFMRINNKEIPRIPPFGTNQGLGHQEIKELVLTIIGEDFEAEIDRQGFDPLDHTLDEVIAFCENLEEAQLTKGKPKVTFTSDTNSQGKKRKASTGNHCMVHGECDHDSNSCKVLKNFAKKLHKEYLAKKEGRKAPPGPSKNKSWSRKAEEKKQQTKKELATMVQQLVQDGLCKELATMTKKRKELLAMEIKQEETDSVDLQEFNYDDLKCSPVQEDNSSCDNLSLPSVSTDSV